VRPASDELLLALAGVSATVIGLFIVGVFFYVEAALRLPERAGLRPYMRSATRIVMVLFAMPIMLPLAVVAFALPWARVLFLLLSVVLVAANVDSARRIRRVPGPGRSRTLLLNEVAGTVGVVVLVVLPWILGALRPSREDLTLAALLAFGLGFASVATMALFIFDIVPAADRRRTDDA
jgi:hypothetical protein